MASRQARGERGPDSTSKNGSPMTTSGRQGLHGHTIGAPNMIRAGIAEAVGSFFLIYAGTATAAAAARVRAPRARRLTPWPSPSRSVWY